MTDEEKTQLLLESLDKISELTQRYIEAEQFIMQLSWLERLFCAKKVNRFLEDVLLKYKH